MRPAQKDAEIAPQNVSLKMIRTAIARVSQSLVSNEYTSASEESTYKLRGPRTMSGPVIVAPGVHGAV